MENKSIDLLKDVTHNLDNLINKFAEIDLRENYQNPQVNHIIKNLKHSIDTALLQINYWEYECEKSIPSLSEEELTLNENLDASDNEEPENITDDNSDFDPDLADLEEVELPSQSTPFDMKNLLSMMMMMNMASDPESILRANTTESSILDILDQADDISSQMDSKNEEHQKYEQMVSDLVDDLD